MPNLPVNFGVDVMDDHELILYNQLQSALRDAVRKYLRRSGEPYPVYFFFNMTGLEQPIL